MKAKTFSSTRINTTLAAVTKDFYTGTAPLSPSDIVMSFGDNGTDVFFDEIRIVKHYPSVNLVSKSFKSKLYTKNKKKYTDALYWSGDYVFV